jgi:hypothetical protein
MLTSQPLVNNRYQSIKISPRLVFREGCADLLPPVNPQLRVCMTRSIAKDTFFWWESVAVVQGPKQFTQDDVINEIGIIDGALDCTKSRGSLQLLEIVLHQKAQEHVAVEASHLRAARLRITASISSSDSRRGAGPRIPFKVDTSMLTGTRLTCPFFSSTNSIRSLGLSLRCFRIACGIEVCP